MTVQEYRKIMNDDISTDERVQERINYLEALCRNIIKNELGNYRKASRISVK